MTQQHPITPPPELVQQWRAAASNVPATLSTAPGGRCDYINYIATRAAQWGADQELLAAGKYLKQCAAWDEEDVIEFYNHRRPRPKPPSLKEQALKQLTESEQMLIVDPDGVIRRALEQLSDES